MTRFASFTHTGLEKKLEIKTERENCTLVFFWFEVIIIVLYYRRKDVYCGTEVQESEELRE